MLRHVLPSTRWLARAAPYSSEFDFLPSTVTLLAQLHRLKENIHKAVAWVGIEVQTKGWENAAASTPYRSMVGAADLLKVASGAPLGEGSSAIDGIMAITEASEWPRSARPAVRDVLAEWSFQLVSNGAFSQPPNGPTTRLEHFYDRLAGPVPESTRGRRAWRQAAAEIEQYRRSYQITDPGRALGPEPRDLNQWADRQRAHSAIERVQAKQRASDLTRDTQPTSERTTRPRSGEQRGRRGPERAAG
jgi:hypothetical protein